MLLLSTRMYLFIVDRDHTLDSTHDETLRCVLNSTILDPSCAESEPDAIGAERAGAGKPECYLVSVVLDSNILNKFPTPLVSAG
jgi:hypothetical protein